MNPRPFSGESLDSHEVQDYNIALRTIAQEEGVPEGAISDRGFALAANCVELMYRNHGDPNQENYKPYHNDTHALNFIPNFWALWKPLRDALPDTFDEKGFELGMLIGASHDLINNPEAARDNPGQNEHESAELMRGLMADAGYDEDDIQRVYDGIIKTTVHRNGDGVITQTYMREGSKDILGLCAGQADMNGILIKGPPALYRDAISLYQEFSPPNKRLSLRGVVGFLREEKIYLRQRVDALAGDLKYYIEDGQKREQIIAVYREKFGGTSLAAIQAADWLHDSPEQLMKLTGTSFNAVKSVAHQGLGRVLAFRRHLVDQLAKDRDTL